jgi:hypothetical protein
MVKEVSCRSTVEKIGSALEFLSNDLLMYATNPITPKIKIKKKRSDILFGLLKPIVLLLILKSKGETRIQI